MIIFKLAVNCICGALDAGGGYHWLWMRRFVMPCVIGVSVAFATHVWWLGFTCLGACGTLCMGYSKDGNGGRGLWMFIQSLALSTGVVAFGHLAWYWYLAYVLGAGILGGIYKNWKQLIGDAITGAYLSSFIWFIHG